MAESWIQCLSELGKEALEGDRGRERERRGGRERKGQDTRAVGSSSGPSQGGEMAPTSPLNDSTGICQFGERKLLKGPLKLLAKSNCCTVLFSMGPDSSHRFLFYDSLYQTTGAPHLCPASVSKVRSWKVGRWLSREVCILSIFCCTGNTSFRAPARESDTLRLKSSSALL